MHRFIVKGTIEDRMHRLLSTVQAPTNSHNSEETNMTLGDLKSLFEQAMIRYKDEDEEDQNEDNQSHEENAARDNVEENSVGNNSGRDNVEQVDGENVAANTSAEENVARDNVEENVHENSETDNVAVRGVENVAGENVTAGTAGENVARDLVEDNVAGNNVVRGLSVRDDVARDFANEDIVDAESGATRDNSVRNNVDGDETEPATDRSGAPINS